MLLSSGDPAYIAYPVFRRPVCPSCGDLFFAAAATEFLGHGKISNVWSCDTCKYEFCTAFAMPYDSDNLT